MRPSLGRGEPVGGLAARVRPREPHLVQLTEPPETAPEVRLCALAPQRFDQCGAYLVERGQALGLLLDHAHQMKPERRRDQHGPVPGVEREHHVGERLAEAGCSLRRG